MMPEPARSGRAWFWAAVALTAAKLWLTRGQAVFAIGSAGYDDLLFVRLAEHLAHGEWLGPYDPLTLAKGPFYSLWIAVAFWLGVPLFLSQHLLYAAACALFTRACRPAIGRPGLRLALYALLLWNPMTFEAASMGRVLRQHVYGPLVLLLFAGLIALHLRRAERWRRLAPWAAMLGFSAAAFWLTREESVWLVPSLALLAGAGLVAAGRTSREALRRNLAALGVAALCALVPVLLVSWMNLRHYRWFGTVEFRAGAFRDAYGAMVRVRVGPDLPFVPVTREAREAMYAVSPSFAELRPFLEGDIGRNWAEVSSGVTGRPADEREIGGGWFTWALRDAVAAAGHAHDARQAMRFYRHIADEINRACDRHQLPAGPGRSGFAPRWREGQTRAVLRQAIDFGSYLTRFDGFTARTPASTGGEDELRLFRDLTGERLSPPEGTAPVTGPKESGLNDWRVTALDRMGHFLCTAFSWLALLAQIAGAVRIVTSAWQGRWNYALTVAVAAWGGFAASMLLHAAIDVTSFPVLAVSSFAPVYPLLLVFSAAVIWDLGVAGQTARMAVPAESAVVARVSVAEPPETPHLRRATWVAGAASLLPFVIWHRQFAELFWFGDDFFLVDQIAAMGFWPWVGHMFSENFAPVFKLLWGGSVLLFDGSYFVLLLLMWLTHALNTLLLGRLLARAGFPWVAVLTAQAGFALSAANLETLGWSVQWSAILAVTFLLLGLWWHERTAAAGAAFSWKRHGGLVLCAAASACSFSRGVLTGPVLALGLLLAGAASARSIGWRAMWSAPLLCLAPAAAVAAMIALYAAGNHEHLGGHWFEVTRFGAAYFLCNPGWILFGGDIWHPLVLTALGAGKIAVVIAGLALARGRTRRLLILCLAYDLGNSLLLGIGRYHTGIEAVTSSRYCYSSLLATLPFAGILLARALETLPDRNRLRTLVPAAAVGVLVVACLLGWPRELESFLVPRGRALRALMQQPTTPPGVVVTVPALDFMHVERAKALIRAFHLH